MAIPLFDKPMLDDRGKRVEVSGLSSRLDSVKRDRGTPKHMTRQQIFAAVVLVAGVTVFLWMKGVFTTGVDLRLMIFAGAIAVGVPASYLAYSLSRGGRAWNWPSVAWLCSYRHCGTCGYDLGATEPGADGIAECPECGASWHAQRWTHEGQNPLDNNGLVYLLRGGYPSSVEADDRGVPVAASGTWYPQWIGSGVVTKDVKRRIKGELHRAVVRRVGIAAMVLVVVIALAIGLHSRSVDWKRDPWRSLQLWLTVYGVLGVVLLALISRLRLRAGVVHAAALRAGRCPGCGVGFPGDAVARDGGLFCLDCGKSVEACRVQFDGGVVCTGCGSSWEWKKAQRLREEGDRSAGGAG